MNTTFLYPCPDCETKNRIHAMNCDYESLERTHIEQAYVAILSVLLDENARRYREDGHPGIPFDELATTVTRTLDDGAWRSLHTACLHTLKGERRVAEDDEGLFLLEPEEREMDVIPTFDPMKTVYEHGPVDGCKDYAVFAMVSWCEMLDFTWEQTVNFVAEWLEETGAWENQSWGESSIEQLLRTKRHVFEKGLGWKHRAENAKGVIENSGHEAQLSVDEKLASVSGPEDYD